MKEFIDKLIGRLEESKERYDDVAFMEMNTNGHTLDFEYANGKKDGVAESISIANQLAEEYNNDFCKWKKYEDKHIYYNNCKWRNEDIDEFTVSQFEFCPYCGKK